MRYTPDLLPAQWRFDVPTALAENPNLKSRIFVTGLLQYFKSDKVINCTSFVVSIVALIQFPGRGDSGPGRMNSVL